MSSTENDNQDQESVDEEKEVRNFLSSDRIILGILVFLFLILLIARSLYLSGIGLEPVEIDRQSDLKLQYQLEINRATWIEWVQLEGVGETLARKIVDYREKNGPFQQIDDLTKINGIGMKTLDKFRPWLRIDHSSDKQELLQKWPHIPITKLFTHLMFWRFFSPGMPTSGLTQNGIKTIIPLM